MLRLIECPRDAMQGLKHFIPTEKKIKFLNLLLEIGFDTLDFGSFVSPKAIPQMADTVDIVPHLNKNNTKLLAIVANYKGALQASQFDKIDLIGFPFSISETFQIRNTHATLNEAFERVAEIQNICEESGKNLILYLSMGFGNPYNDPWSIDIIDYWLSRMLPLGIRSLQLSDTIVMETGGMKGQGRELPRSELHDILKTAFGVNQIHSEYGMTELLSQAYAPADGYFYESSSLKILIRDITDPFREVPDGKVGAVNIIDLANKDSISFIATDDLGRKCQDGTFEILGRLDNAEIRGCNLLVHHLS